MLEHIWGLLCQFPVKCNSNWWLLCINIERMFILINLQKAVGEYSASRCHPMPPKHTVRDTGCKFHHQLLTKLSLKRFWCVWTSGVYERSEIGINSGALITYLLFLWKPWKNHRLIKYVEFEGWCKRYWCTKTIATDLQVQSSAVYYWLVCWVIVMLVILQRTLFTICRL
jgi:hypothetical protein